MSQPPQYPEHPSGPEGGTPDPAQYPESSDSPDGGGAESTPQQESPGAPAAGTSDPTQTPPYGAPGYPPPLPPPPGYQSPPPGFPAQPPGYPPQPSGYQPPQPGYPGAPAGYPAPPPGFPPPQQPGYPAPPSDYQPQQPGFQPQQPGYQAPQQPGYPAPPSGYPPQQPGYPGSGGYPPPPGYGAPVYGSGYPPTGGYPVPGYPQPGYPPPGFGGPGGPEFDVGQALSWAWNKFSKNAGALIVPMLCYGAAMVVLYMILVFGLMGAPSGEPEPISGGQFGTIIVVYLLMLVGGAFVQIAYLSGVLDIADGKPVGIGSFFAARNFGTAILTGLLVGVATGIGNLLCIIPGMIALFFFQFGVPFAVDRGLSPVDAVKASVAVCRANVGPALLSLLVQVAVMAVGWMLCGVGALVGIPMALLIQVYTYRRLSGGWVAPMQP